MAAAAGDKIRSYWLGTSGLPAVEGAPVRVYTSGSRVGDVVAAARTDEPEIVGFAAGSCSTAGYGVPVVTEEGAHVLATVQTTVTQGQLLRATGSNKLVAAAGTAGNKYCAVALEARTNTGACWVRYEKGETDA